MLFTSKENIHQIACGVGYSILHYLVVAGAMLDNNVEAPKPQNIEVPKPYRHEKISLFCLFGTEHILEY
jgi:hypothetical protein